MPRRNKNARAKPKVKKLKIKKPKAVLIPIHNKKDNISPGVLVAAAERLSSLKASSYSACRMVQRQLCLRLMEELGDWKL